jgi:hypothetical protein
MEAVVTRVHRRFPERSLEAIRHAVTEAWHAFDGSPVRDFVAILVEREVTESLRRQAVG